MNSRFIFILSGALSGIFAFSTYAGSLETVSLDLSKNDSIQFPGRVASITIARSDAANGMSVMTEFEENTSTVFVQNNRTGDGTMFVHMESGQAYAVAVDGHR